MVKTAIRPVENKATYTCSISEDVLPLIRVATLKDIPELQRVASSVRLSTLQKNKKANLADTGFLVSDYTEETYADFITRVDNFLVLEIKGKIVAFCLAYSSEYIIDKKEELNAHIRDTICKKFILIKQICVSLKYKSQGYAQMLYSELFSRNKFDGDNERPFYTVIVAKPSNPRSLKFHNLMGFKKVKDYLPPDNMPRQIFCKEPVTLKINLTKAMPEQDMLASYQQLQDNNCVGLGIALYQLEPPHEKGTFFAEIRIMMKWLQPGIEKKFPKKLDASRTALDLNDKSLRVPNFAMNTTDATTTQNYAYLDKGDPKDLITCQRVVKGKFSANIDLHKFPFDTQKLGFRFRMWDSNPDDRCRYFRLLPFCDGTPWSKCRKSNISAIESAFQKPSAMVGVDPTAGTSYLKIEIVCVRRTWYYLRNVVIPLGMVSILVGSSVAVDKIDYATRAANNLALLLTAVAFMFIAREDLPKVSYMTQLDQVSIVSYLLIIIKLG
eukprot:g3208.t1